MVFFFTAGDGVMVGVQLVVQCELCKIINMYLICFLLNPFFSSSFLFIVSILSFFSLKALLCQVDPLFSCSYVQSLL
jgi:hypothetical protein